MKVNFYGIKLHLLRKREILDLLLRNYSDQIPVQLFFLNAHCYNVATKDLEYQKALEKSSYILNDGIGIKIGCKFRSIEVPDNLNGTDLIPEYLQYMCGQTDASVFLLGAKPGIAEKAADLLTSEYNVHIADINDGYFKNDSEIIQKINNSNASILVVGMGVPMQEKWIHKNMGQLKNVKCAIAGGAILDFLSGNVTRAPLFFRKTGLEWLYRLFLEPKRLWKRYLIGNILFFINIFRNRKTQTGEVLH